MTEYVTTTDVLFFHRHLIDLYGGAAGVRDAGALESALHGLQTGCHESLVHEAAALLESLVQSRPFTDGNERIAFAAVDVFLRINGHAIAAEPTWIHHRMMELIETGTFDMEHLVPWLEKIVRPR